MDFESVTGIEKRRVREDGENSRTLAVDAVEACLENSQYGASELDAIIFTGITKYLGDGEDFFLEPSMSSFLKKELGAENAMNFDLTNACAGMASGAYLLDGMIKSGTVENGLVVSGECITPIAETAAEEIDEPFDDQLASLTVGDAGAAFIMDEGNGTGDGEIDLIELCNVAEYADLCFGMPSDENSGPAMYTKPVQIHQQTYPRIIPLVEWMLDELDATPEDFDYAIPHQTSVRAINSGMDIFKESAESEVNEENIPDIACFVPELGNTASTSLFVALHEAYQNGEVEDGDRVVILTFASGIIIGVLTLTFDSDMMGVGG
ncbi:MAG: 3-oxoacyl-[acyl-carrier-protein] synthase III C-terminal domain-containing protein [Halobacteria archaeon]|nr:3-oxoacyl-[acyl-carrier-protein] synthase III C-terminal domain-containing protein [Halobacteria archaeon]